MPRTKMQSTEAALSSAAVNAGMSLSAWAKRVLLRGARRQQR